MNRLLPVWRESIVRRREEGSLPHAFLIHGPTGIGKTEEALHLAALFVCESETDRPCGECDACTSFGEYGDLDFRLLRPVEKPCWVSPEELAGLSDPGASLKRFLDDGFLAPSVPEIAGRTRIPLTLASTHLFRRVGGRIRYDRAQWNRRVENGKFEPSEERFLLGLVTPLSLARYSSTIGIGHISGDSVVGADTAILKWISRKPSGRRRKVVILEDADRMTEEAQNSLLKTLEEPPADSVLVLTTARREGLLETIRSRCEDVRLSPLGETDMRDALGTYFDSLADDDARELMQLGEGVPGRAALVDLDRHRRERGEVEELIGWARSRSFDRFFTTLEAWIEGIESANEDSVAVARRRLTAVLSWSRDRAVEQNQADFDSMERLFRSTHRAAVSLRPGANLRLYLEEFGRRIWDAFAREGTPA